MRAGETQSSAEAELRIRGACCPCGFAAKESKKGRRDSGRRQRCDDPHVAGPQLYDDLVSNVALVRSDFDLAEENRDNRLPGVTRQRRCGGGATRP